MRVGRAGLASLIVAVAVLLLFPAAAGADPARPSDFRSEVTAVRPGVSSVEVRVVGGDAFLDLSVAPGHEVLVEDYGGQPYLRFQADGTVEENRRSPATYINEDRFATTEVPPGLSSDAAADRDWRVVAEDGTYAWHDHRIHFMARTPTPALERGQVVRWSVPLRVDGEAVRIEGGYRLVGHASARLPPGSSRAISRRVRPERVRRRRRAGPAGSQGLVVASAQLTRGTSAQRRSRS